MIKMQPNQFPERVQEIRAAYADFIGLQKRTHTALYSALALGYALWNEIRTDERMRARFNDLLVNRPKRQRDNPTLFLVIYFYFPQLLKDGHGNKRDQNQASRFAALFNRASERGISSPNFASEARAIGLQGAATGWQQKGGASRKRITAKRIPSRGKSHSSCNRKVSK